MWYGWRPAVVSSDDKHLELQQPRSHGAVTFICARLSQLCRCQLHMCCADGAVHPAAPPCSAGPGRAAGHRRSRRHSPSHGALADMCGLPSESHCVLKCLARLLHSGIARHILVHADRPHGRWVTGACIQHLSILHHSSLQPYFRAGHSAAHVCLQHEYHARSYSISCFRELLQHIRAEAGMRARSKPCWGRTWYSCAAQSTATRAPGDPCP